MFHKSRAAWLATVCFAAFGIGGTAVAAPVTASYTGQVTGYTFGPTALDTALPAGTSVSWNLTFDDAFLGLSLAEVFGAPTQQAVTGSLRIGSNVYSLDQMHLFALSYDGATQAVLWYRFQILGIGPSVAGADFFGLWATFDPTLALSGESVGYGFTTTFPDGSQATGYTYADTAGAYSLRATSVPEPESFALMGAALAVIGFARRRRAPAQ